MRDTKAEILHFWFEETEPRQWFQKNDAFDQHVIERFLGCYKMAADGLCDGWRQDAEGCVALCIVLDQFPRNMFRGRPETFATDHKALLVAKHATANKFDEMVALEKRRFLYLPYEHSEDLQDQKRSVELFARIREGDPVGYEYALRHLQVIEQFGRFPHRNAILQRENTAEESAYLSQEGAGF